MRRGIVWIAMIAGFLFLPVASLFAQADRHAHHGETSSDDPRADGATDLPPFVPQLTDDDRRAAFPDLHEHSMHGNSVNYFILFDQLEWQTRQASDFNLDSRGWVGFDRDRLWFRAEGDRTQGAIGDARAHLLYGRQFSRWWDIVAGVRQDVQPGPAQTWFAIGVQGLAPQWFEIEATAYISPTGRTQARLEVEYEMLLSNRLKLQPLLEAEIYGRSDPSRGIGAGLGTTEAGLRLRYEWRREFAPYVGVTWMRRWGATADLATSGGQDIGWTQFVTGLRLWF